MPEARDCTQLSDCRAEAKRLIEKGSVEAYDYCANIGQQFDNVKHMKSFIEGFARWLQQGC